ncbi:MAG: class I SAM-dependent methyltransferase [Acidimicrobiia bacterium]|nr:class I SAM-dependent methyltransferase [Acidimicrobiia bacterium]
MFKKSRRLEEAPPAAGVDDLSETDARIVAAVQPHTMTPPARVAALLRAIDYVERRGLPGAYVECGVWRGGSVLAMVLKLLDLGVTTRHVYAFDSFEGMPEPTSADTSRYSGVALDEWRAAREARRRPWAEMFDPASFNVDAVRGLLLANGYPAGALHVEAGRVEETIPGAAPDELALLRLDTDWYESTRHELVHLYPRLVTGGVLIIDDYGHWEGCRRAVDEYFANESPPILLTPVDYTCRIGVKA